MILRIEIDQESVSGRSGQYITNYTINVNVNGVPATIIPEGGNVIARVNIPGAKTDINTVSISVSKGSSSYGQVFTLFGYDVNMRIVMLHTTYTGITNAIIAYRQPFTDNIFIYNAVADSTSQFGNIKANAVVVSDSEDYLGTQVNTRRVSQNSMAVISTDTFVVDSFTDRLDYTQYVNIQNNLLNPNITTAVSIGVQIPYANLEQRLVDDVLDYMQEEDVIAHRILSPDNSVVRSSTFTVPKSDFDVNGLTPYNPSAHILTFTPQDIGDYLIETTLTMEGIVSVKKVTLKGTNIFTILNGIITNNTVSDSLDIEVLQLIDGVFVSLYSIVLPSGSTALTFPTDGVYKIIVTRPGQTSEGIYIERKGITECFSNAIDSIMCIECGECEEPYLMFNKIKSLVELFELHVNAFNVKYAAENIEYSFEFVHTVADVNLLDLHAIDAVVARISKYCGLCESKFPCI